MAYNKEELDALLKFIIDICNKDENKWFKEELIKALGCEQKHSQAFVAFGNGLSDRVKDIEKYLALDYKIDFADSIIDYSFVKDKGCQDCLTQDNREMLRYRMHCRGHKPDFLDFCKFAHFQIEGLLNYYYNTITGNISEIIDNIEKYLPEGFSIKEKEKKQKVSDISFNDKRIAFCNQFNSTEARYPLGYLFNETIDFIRRARNDVNHRSGEREKSSESYYEKFIRKSGLPFTDSDFDTYTINENPYLKERFYKEYRFTKKYIDYRYYLFLKNMRFHEVVNVVAKIVQVVKIHVK